MKKTVEMALATVWVIVAAAAVLTAKSSSASRAEPTVLQCVVGKATIVREITAPGTSFKVLCMQKDGSQKLDSRPLICADPQCVKEDKDKKTLPLACPGGSAEDAPSDETNGLIVTCPQLPNSPATLLLLCGKIHPLEANVADVCAVELRALPPPPQGPQVCAAPGTTTTLGIHGDKSHTEFGCPSAGLTALHPSTTGKVFKEDCASEEDLKDLTLTAGTPYNTLVATGKPRTRKLCYVCRSASDSKKPPDECKVFIDVSGGPRRFGRTAIGPAISFALAVLPLN